MGIVMAIISVLLIALACRNFLRWRRSNFETVTGYLRNVKRIPDGVKANIPVETPSGTITCTSGKRHKPLIYFEIVYRVNGIEYFDWEFNEDDNEPLPQRWKMHYHRKNPNWVYRDGAIRDGIMLAWVFLVMGVSLLFGCTAFL